MPRTAPHLAHALARCSLNHTVLLCTSGEVWVSGYNRCGQLGLGRGRPFVGAFVRVRCPPATQASAGANYTLLVGEPFCVFEVRYYLTMSVHARLQICHATLLGAGCNHIGQLGQRPSKLQHENLQWTFAAWDAPTLDGSPLASVFAGAGRTFALTGKGQLLASDPAAKWSSSWGVFKPQMSFHLPSACSVVVGCLSCNVMVLAPEVRVSVRVRG